MLCDCIRVLKKKIKKTQKVKQSTFNLTIEDRMQILKVVLFYKPQILQKTNNERNNLSAAGLAFPAALDVYTRLT